MPTTIVAGYSDKARAAETAANFKVDHKVIVIGPTDRVEADFDNSAGKIWEGPLYLVIATQDPVAD